MVSGHGMMMIVPGHVLGLETLVEQKKAALGDRRPAPAMRAGRVTVSRPVRRQTVLGPATVGKEELEIGEDELRAYLRAGWTQEQPET